MRTDLDSSIVIVILTYLLKVNCCLVNIINIPGYYILYLLLNLKVSLGNK